MMQDFFQKELTQYVSAKDHLTHESEMRKNTKKSRKCREIRNKNKSRRLWSVEISFTV